MALIDPFNAQYLVQNQFWSVFIQKGNPMAKNRNIRIRTERQKQLEFIGLVLKEMRLSEGKNQDDLVNEGVGRRLVQRAECGCNISIAKLLSILECYGYTLKDLEYDEN